MKNKNLQSANDWINDLIIALKPVLYKTTRQYIRNFIVGAILVCGTVSDWVRAVHQQERFRKFYNQIGRFGVRYSQIQSQFVCWTFKRILPLLPDTVQITFACDDTPIKRYGDRVQGAGWQFHQSNGNRDSDKYYGFSLVVISLIIKHHLFGTISLPLMNCVYVPKDELNNIPIKKRPEFKTKLQQLVEMMTKIVELLKLHKKTPILLFDKGYVSEEVFTAMKKLNVTIITQFKSNANFYREVVPSNEVKRGRPRKYGEKLKLSEIVANNDEFPLKQMDVQLYGQQQTIEYKTCIVTSHISDGQRIRIILSRIVKKTVDSKDKQNQHEKRWCIFVSTDLTFNESFILEEYSRRFSIEEMFKDLKEVCGLGQQQVRNFASNVATFNLILMNYTLVELWAWLKPASELIQCRGIWDNKNRRPSHKDKRIAMQLELKCQDLLRLYPKNLKPNIIQNIKNSLLEYISCT